MRHFITGVLFILLLCIPAGGIAAQPQDQFFSGTVTTLTDSKITVSRTVLGREAEVRTFILTPETRLEGKPHVKSRVTVRFVSTDDGDRAVHVLVRTTQKKAGTG